MVEKKRKERKKKRRKKGLEQTYETMTEEIKKNGREKKRKRTVSSSREGKKKFRGCLSRLLTINIHAHISLLGFQ